MIISEKDAEDIACAFFDLVDSHYGAAIHHIGDGDGISETNAEKYRSLYLKYRDYYWKDRAIKIALENSAP